MFVPGCWYKTDRIASWQIVSGIFSINDAQVFAVRHCFSDITALALVDTYNPSIAEILDDGSVINADDRMSEEEVKDMILMRDITDEGDDE